MFLKGGLQKSSAFNITKEDLIMKNMLLYLPAAFLFVLLFSTFVYAHCEIPCGIYNDEMRIEMINEHITTIEKAMNTIIELEEEGHQHYNQLVRWIMNKEDHANKIQEIASQYFMTQRIKSGTKDYEKKLALLHEMLISSMKCKQTTDLDNVATLRKLVKDFQALYFKKE
jgi:nickel superoxide dismutase